MEDNLYGAANSVLLDWRELQHKWALDEVCDEITNLMNYLDSHKDAEGLRRFAALIKAINNYNNLMNDMMQDIAAPTIAEVEDE